MSWLTDTISSKGHRVTMAGENLKCSATSLLRDEWTWWEDFPNLRPLLDISSNEVQCCRKMICKAINKKNLNFNYLCCRKVWTTFLFSLKKILLRWMSCEDSDKRVCDTNSEERNPWRLSVNLYGWGLIFFGVCDAYCISKLFQMCNLLLFPHPQ